MAARTKPAPETEAEVEKTAETPSTDEDKKTIREVVEEILTDLLPAKSEETVIEEPAAEPQTAREEEKHTRSVVSQAIEEFLAAAKPQPTSAPETETEPGKTTTRKIEKWLWGKE